MKRAFIKILVVILLSLFVGVAWAAIDWKCWESCMRAGGNDNQCRVICR